MTKPPAPFEIERFYRDVWCCQALIWGIALYDTKKQQESFQ
jgi:hypothetical protein